MTTTMLAQAPVASGRELLSPGIGAEAASVDKSLGEWNHTRLASRTLSRFSVWLDLVDVHAECGAPGWDGEGAEPVSPATISKAQAFLSALPSDIPDPHVGPDPDGEVSFDWFDEPDWGVAVALSANGRLSYAATFGAARAHGTERFQEDVPRPVIGLLRRLYRG